MLPWGHPWGPQHRPEASQSVTVTQWKVLLKCFFFFLNKQINVAVLQIRLQICIQNFFSKYKGQQRNLCLPGPQGGEFFPGLFSRAVLEVGTVSCKHFFLPVNILFHNF